MEIRLPQGIQDLLRRLPTELPLESTIDRALDELERRVAALPTTRILENLHSKLPVIPEVEVGTPLGMIKTPEISLPVPALPKIDDRRRTAVKAAIATDLSAVIGMIPVVGDVVADVVEDIYGARIRKVLTKEEMDTYMKYDKLGPSTYAMLRAFIRRRSR